MGSWRIGILGQALVPLALGTTLVVAAVTIFIWRYAVDQERAVVLRQLAQRSEGRSLAEQPTFDRVARQVRACRDMLVARAAVQQGPVPPMAQEVDGTCRLLPGPDGPPVALFMSPTAACNAGDVAVASLARDLIVEFGAVLAEQPANLTIAAPGRWLVGWGAEACELVDSMLPNDPVLLPAEQEVLREPGPVRWSRAFLEPASGRYQVVATASADLAGAGRVAVAQILPVDEILRRATAGHIPGSETIVIDAGGRLLASTTSGSAAAESLLARISATIALSGPAHELVPLADGSGLLGVSRFPGPDWIMATVHPESAIAGQARTATGFAISLGCVLLAAQTVLLFVVLRSRVAHPLQRLSLAAGALAAGRRDIDLPAGRQDEVGQLSAAFATMSAAVAARERQLQEAAEALREREQMASALVASAADAVMIISGGIITEANPRACALFGYDLAQITGRGPEALSPDLQADGRTSAACAAELLGRAAAGAVMHFPWRHRRADGSEFDAEVGLARIDLPGELRMVAVLRDVTRRNQLEEQLRQGQKLESLGQLAGGIAHDFNNMLAGIMASAELLRSSEDPQRRLELVDMITTASERAAGLTAKLLSFARKGRVMSSVVDLHQIVNDTHEILRSTLDKRIVIEVESSASRASVVGDASQLQNMLLNLAVNARDAMDQGGRLRFATRMVVLDADAAARQALPVEPGAYIELSVADSGTGIPPAILGRIFEPFFTTKAVGKGTGLGLSAVWGTVRDHHGSIAVESRPGAGTTFRIILPLAGTQAVHRPHREHKPQIRQGRGTVLLIEDETLVRHSARLMLESLGWEVVEASDGRDGVEVFARERARISIVMVDMEMPRLRGIDCMRELRAIDPTVVVVLCSGFARDGTLEELLGEGFSGQISKPYRLAELDQVLDAAARPR